ncbi:MAG: Mini-ribonuclease 3 [Clostridia bacterium]|nr:Mini-ribonuclease 3 [Clostridia bacterium]
MHERILGAALPSVMALAYIGDARHSLFVRTMLVERGICKSGELNAASLEYVTAEAQAQMARRIEPYLLEDEREVYRRAANSGHLNKPKHSSAADYRAATGFEAVVGMLSYIGDEERLRYLLQMAHSDGDAPKRCDTNNAD